MKTFDFAAAVGDTSLAEQAARLRSKGLSALQQEAGRVNRWVLDAPGTWRMDFTKQLIDQAAWAELKSLAESADWKGAVESEFAGEAINVTEQRAVLHMALRGEAEDAFQVGGQDVMPEVLETRDRMLAFVDAVRSGHYTTARDGKFRNVINIGIGGSDLGPVMVHEALAPIRMKAGSPLEVRFVSNVDPFHLDEALSGLDPAETLVVIVSKTFTTQETMANAQRALQWLENGLGKENAGQHMAAVSSNVAGASAMGIDPGRVFGFSDWVGGRFSLWGPVGLSVALGSGANVFRELLAGARDMDRHFKDASADANVPLHMALIELWNVNVLGFSSRVVLPYAQALKSWPAYLQQAEMESNGKSVGRDGKGVTWSTSPVVWGAAGTNGQHAFHQLLHQGTELHPMDFVGFRLPMGGDAGMHKMLLANAVAQAEAFCEGRKLEEVQDEMRAAGASEQHIERVAPHRAFDGGRPSTFMLAEKLSAHAIGALIAAHEHKIFLEGLLWGVYSFDQWGVELGKKLAKAMLSESQGQTAWTAGTEAMMALLEGDSAKS